MPKTITSEILSNEAKLINGVIVFNKLEWEGARGEKRNWQIIVEATCDASISTKIPIVASWLDSNILKDNQGKSIYGVYKTIYGMVGGLETVSAPKFIAAGKNIGKANETSSLRQAVSDALSEYNKKITTISSKVVVKSDNTTVSLNINIDGVKIDEESHKEIAFIKPMRAHKLGDTKKSTIDDSDYINGLFVQKKLDGVNCIFIRDFNGDVIGYSRKLKPLMGCRQVVEEMEFIYSFTGGINPYFVGEMYIHGRDLQWIVGQFTKEEDEGNLHYFIYDVFFIYEKEYVNLTAKDRQDYLNRLFAKIESEKKMSFVHRLETKFIHSKSELDTELHNALDEGYEGVIVRRPQAIFSLSMSDKRSPDIIKIKPRQDKEFKIVDYTEGEGKHSGAIIWICVINEDMRIDPTQYSFTVESNNCELEERKKLFTYLRAHPDVFDRLFKYREITIEYSDLSATTNIPLQPRARTLYPRDSYENTNSEEIEEYQKLITYISQK